MNGEDLEGGDEMRQGDALVTLPLLVGLLIIHEDDEGLVVALEADLVNLSLAASHFVWCEEESRVLRCLWK